MNSDEMQPPDRLVSEEVKAIRDWLNRPAIDNSMETYEDQLRAEGWPQGPALMYVHSGGAVGMRTVTRVDNVVPGEGGPFSMMDATRERRVLRALLEHALWLLDREEPA